jgi:hypothetical protein
MSYKSKRTPLFKKKRNKTVKGGMIKLMSNRFGKLFNMNKTTKKELDKYMADRNTPLNEVGLEQVKKSEAPNAVKSEEPTNTGTSATVGKELILGNKPLGTRIGGYYKCKNKNKSNRK